MFHNNQDKYSALLYNWFGGIYDGQSYYIKNIRISSHCYNVGLFGSTAGAEIRNIVLYSDNGSVIERDTDASSWTYQGAGLELGVGGVSVEDALLEGIGADGDAAAGVAVDGLVPQAAHKAAHADKVAVLGRGERAVLP